MKKLILPILCFFLLSWVSVQARMTLMVIGGGGVAGPDQFDDWTSGDFSKWTEETAGWSVVAGQALFTRNGTSEGGIRYTGAGAPLSGLNVYARMEIVDLIYSQGLVMRAGDGTGNDWAYFVRVIDTSVFIKEGIWPTMAQDATLESDATAWSDGDILCVTCCGTGTDTVWSIWKDCVNTYAYDCDNWDSAVDAADVVFTNNPVRSASGPEEADARYIGVYAYPTSGNTEIIDNFSAGAF